MARLKFALIEVLVTVLIDLIECRLGVARALCDWGVQKFIVVEFAVTVDVVFSEAFAPVLSSTLVSGGARVTRDQDKREGEEDGENCFHFDWCIIKES